MYAITHVFLYVIYHYFFSPFPKTENLNQKWFHWNFKLTQLIHETLDCNNNVEEGLDIAEC